MGSVFERTRIHKDGKKASYLYIVYSVNGKRKWESAGQVGVITKTYARELLKKRERQVKLEQWDMIEVKVPTLDEFSNYYIEYIRDIKHNRSWNDAVYYLSHLLQFFDGKKLSNITPADIEDYQKFRLAEGAKPATVNRERACLSHLFNLAKRRQKFFGVNPVSQVQALEENNQRERILSPEEEERLLSCCSPHLKPIIITALYTGMRKGEIINLKWENIDLKHNIITIKNNVSKNKKTRRIPISSAIRRVFLKQRLQNGRADFVFISSNGNPYKRHDSLKKPFQVACQKANIEELRFHDLRHTAATRMVEAKAGIVAVSRILGHSSLKMTMRYAHPEDSLRDAVEKLANFKGSVSQSVSQREK